jgi:hypothetical protein
MSLMGLLVVTEILLTAWIHDWLWIFNPIYAEDEALMTPKGQWNSSLSIQCCLLCPYARIKVIDSCLICPWGCWWSQKFCWQLGSMITEFQPNFWWGLSPHDTNEPMKLFHPCLQYCLLSPYARIKVVDSCLRGVNKNFRWLNLSMLVQTTLTTSRWFFYRTSGTGGPFWPGLQPPRGSYKLPQGFWPAGR